MLNRRCVQQCIIVLQRATVVAQFRTSFVVEFVWASVTSLLAYNTSRLIPEQPCRCFDRSKKDVGVGTRVNSYRTEEKYGSGNMVIVDDGYRAYFLTIHLCLNPGSACLYSFSHG
jgi:hypothetical protein